VIISDPDPNCNVNTDPDPDRKKISDPGRSVFTTLHVKNLFLLTERIIVSKRSSYLVNQSEKDLVMDMSPQRLRAQSFHNEGGR